MRILVGCLLHPQSPKLYGRTNQSIFRLTHQPLEILFRSGDNPTDEGNANILHNYNSLADATIRGGYDYLLTVEYDMVIPDDTVEKLLECDADVAYGLYVFKGNVKWSAYLEIDRYVGQSLSSLPDLARERWGKITEVAGVGLGCTLISRNVLENVPFRTLPGAANDWFFAIDLQAGGYKQRCHLGVQCGHITLDPSPRVLWPDPEMPHLYRNDFINGLPINENGEVEITIGQLGEFYIPETALYRPMSELREREEMAQVDGDVR